MELVPGIASVSFKPFLFRTHWRNLRGYKLITCHIWGAKIYHFGRQHYPRLRVGVYVYYYGRYLAGFTHLVAGWTGPILSSLPDVAGFARSFLPKVPQKSAEFPKNCHIRGKPSLKDTLGIAVIICIIPWPRQGGAP